jgi:hypothetical protein
MLAVVERTNDQCNAHCRAVRSQQKLALGALRVTYKRHLEDVRPTEKMR